MASCGICIIHNITKKNSNNILMCAISLYVSLVYIIRERYIIADVCGVYTNHSIKLIGTNAGKRILKYIIPGLTIIV